MHKWLHELQKSDTLHLNKTITWVGTIYSTHTAQTEHLCIEALDGNHMLSAASLE